MLQPSLASAPDAGPLRSAAASGRRQRLIPRGMTWRSLPGCDRRHLVRGRRHIEVWEFANDRELIHGSLHYSRREHARKREASKFSAAARRCGHSFMLLCEIRARSGAARHEFDCEEKACDRMRFRKGRPWREPALHLPACRTWRAVATRLPVARACQTGKAANPLPNIRPQAPRCRRALPWPPRSIRPFQAWS